MNTDHDSPFYATRSHPSPNHWNHFMCPLDLMVHNQQHSYTQNSLNIIFYCSEICPFPKDTIFSKHLSNNNIFSHTSCTIKCESDFPTPHWCLQITLQFFFSLHFHVESPCRIRFSNPYTALYFKKVLIFLAHSTMLFHVTMTTLTFHIIVISVKVDYINV